MKKLLLRNMSQNGMEGHKKTNIKKTIFWSNPVNPIVFWKWLKKI